MSGTTTYINTTTLNIGDNIITLNADIPGTTAPTENAGIEVKRGTQATKQFYWNESGLRWYSDSDFYVNGNIGGSGNITISGTIDTGQGATEVYLMNQNVRTSDSVTFNQGTFNSTLSFTNYLYGNSKRAFDTSDSYLRLNQNNDFTSGVYTPYNFRADGTIYAGGATYYINNGTSYLNSLTLANNLVLSGTIDTGIGATEVYLMNQNIRTSDSPTFAGVTVNPIALTAYNVRDLQIKGTGGSDIGLLGYGSSNQFGFQLYGDGGGNYGFLNGAWASWDLRKNVSNGNLYMNNDGTYYLNTNGTSNLYGLTVNQTITGNISGNAGSANYANYLPSFDTRGTNDQPQSYNNIIRYDFKANGTDGLSDGGSYHGVMFWRSYGGTTDMSGGYPMQMAYTANQRLWARYGVSTTSWSSWYRFLDSNSDPYAVNMNQYVRTTDNPTFNSVYIYNGNTRLTQGDGTALRITTAYGYGNLGPQNSSWFHFSTDRANFYFGNPIYVDGSGIYTYGGNTWMEKNAIYSPIYYTNGTTSYYLNPANSSYVNTLNANNLTIGSSQVWYNSGSWLGDLGSYGFTRSWGLSMSGGSEFVLLYKSGQGYTLVDGSYYAYEAGGFYSSNNSSYGTLLGFYADSTSSVRFNATVKTGGSLYNDYYYGSDGAFVFRVGSNAGTNRHINLWNSTSDPSSASSDSGITWGQRSDNQPYYMMYVKSPYNNGYSTHSRLTLAWHTGLEIGAYYGYGGTRFFNNSPAFGTEIFSVGKSDNNVRVENNIYAGTYYDWDTSYYVDANSTSQFYRVSVNEYLYARNGAGRIYLSGNLHIDSFSGNSIYNQYYSNLPIRNYGHTYNNGYGMYSINELYAQVFYDDNDSAYRVNPNSDSRLWQLGVGYQLPSTRLHVVGDHGNSRLRVTLAASNNGSGQGDVNMQIWCSEPGNTWNGAGIGYNVDNASNQYTNTYYWGRLNTNHGQGYIRFEQDGGMVLYNTNTSGTRYTNQYWGINYTYVYNYLEGANSLRAPIFYDNQDTNYYADPNGTSHFSSMYIYNLYYRGDGSYGQIGANNYSDTVNSGYDSDPLELVYYRGYPGVRIGTGGGTRSLTAGDIYSNAWFRQNGSGGLYWEPYGRGIASPENQGNSYGHITTYGGGRSGWYGYGVSSTHCLMTTTGDNFGLHDNRYSWIWYWDGGAFNVYRGYTYSVGSMRSPIFYDSDNTGYYFGSGSGDSRLNWVGANNFYCYPGYMFYSDPGGWTGEYYKIQWHSSHLYFQRQQWGYFIFRNPNGSEGAYINDNNLYLSYLGWMSNYVNQSVTSGASPTFGEVYANGWFRNNGGGGLYNQSYGSHIRTNFDSSYGCYQTFGYYRGGYGGMLVNDPSGYYNNLMFESGNGGIYVQNGNGWSYYYSRGNNCASVDSTTYGFIRFNIQGSVRFRQFINMNYNADGNIDVQGGFGVYYRSSGGYNTVVQTDGYNSVYIITGGGSYGGVVMYPGYYYWNSYSDRRIKNILGPIENGVSSINRLTPIYFTNTLEYTKGREDTIVKMGLIAQEVQEVFPNIVREDEKTGYLTVSYESLIPVLIKSVKELSNDVNFLKAQNEYLLERLETLEQLNGITITSGSSG